MGRRITPLQSTLRGVQGESSERDNLRTSFFAKVCSIGIEFVLLTLTYSPT